MSESRGRCQYGDIGEVLVFELGLGGLAGTLISDISDSPPLRHIRHKATLCQSPTDHERCCEELKRKYDERSAGQTKVL